MDAGRINADGGAAGEEVKRQWSVVNVLGLCTLYFVFRTLLLCSFQLRQDKLSTKYKALRTKQLTTDH